MIIDSHTHLFIKKKNQSQLILSAQRNNISKLCVSSLGRNGDSPVPTIKEVKEANDDVLALMKEYPQEVIGFCYLNPRHRKKAIEELERCFDQGMRGVKLWIAAKASNPIVFSIIEKATELKLPILQHTWFKITGNLSYESTPADVVELAVRYPKAKIIIAHLGGDWQRTIPTIKAYPNIYGDTSGTYPESGIIEEAVKQLGPGRVIFGSDAPGRSFSVQLAKIKAAHLPLKIKRKIWGETILSLLG